MLDISWGGLLGAIAGTIVSALLYGTLIDAIERFLKARRDPLVAPVAGSEIALLRRAVLSANILVFAGLGYLIGHMIDGYAG
jgi:hypothetical protein